MAVTMELITKLRHMTSAGLMDCKKALAETDGNIEAAVEILRKKGQAVAAKREDRNAAEGCTLSKNEGSFAAIVALNCETDFVAQNAGFVGLTQQILDVAVANRIESKEALEAFEINGRSIHDLIIEESGKTGEKMELGAYEWLTAPSTTSYNHPGNHLATIVGFNQEGVDYQVGRDVAMQVAAMNPVAACREDVPASVIESERNVAIDKTKEELVRKAVNAALGKAGLNANHFDSEDHINSNITKGWITEEEAAKGREIIAKVSAEKAANLPAQMIENIANGRVGKFYKESCLMEQEYVKDATITIGQYLDKASKGLVAVSFKRVNLNKD
ncbi:MAG: translation elongation factor Ts [Pseudoflavonifractor sp.]|nr:translation elongation factor Ts [Alloprevotella sp.]MCM1115978.1 translation elongation factor Ts [Pseudoflavonifractor sp.]